MASLKPRSTPDWSNGLPYVIRQSHPDQVATEVSAAATDDEALKLASASAAKVGASPWIMRPDRGTIRVYAEGDTNQHAHEAR